MANIFLLGKEMINLFFAFCNFFTVVAQPYEAEADNEYVISGNSVVMKCEIPSFVSDFVTIVNWIDSEGHTYFQNENYGKQECLNFFYFSMEMTDYSSKAAPIFLLFFKSEIFFLTYDI